MKIRIEDTLLYMRIKKASVQEFVLGISEEDFKTIITSKLYQTLDVAMLTGLYACGLGLHKAEDEVRELREYDLLLVDTLPVYTVYNDEGLEWVDVNLSVRVGEEFTETKDWLVFLTYYAEQLTQFLIDSDGYDEDFSEARTDTIDRFVDGVTYDASGVLTWALALLRQHYGLDGGMTEYVLMVNGIRDVLTKGIEDYDVYCRQVTIMNNFMWQVRNMSDEEYRQKNDNYFTDLDAKVVTVANKELIISRKRLTPKGMRYTYYDCLHEDGGFYK